MASPGANIPVSNTYAQALAPNITLPGVSLSGMPETVSLLQGSIPQIPTSGILNYNPIQISEAGWNPPRAGADILGFVEKYNESKKKANDNGNDNGVEGADVETDPDKMRYRIHLPYKDKDGNWVGFRIVDKWKETADANSAIEAMSSGGSVTGLHDSKELM